MSDSLDIPSKSSTGSTALPSPTQTHIDLTAALEKQGSNSSLQHLPKSVEGSVENVAVATKPQSNILADLSPARKSIALLCFCLAMFIDSAGVSATFLLTEEISIDLGIKPGDQAWVLGTYTLAFASTLLFSGRLADLYSPSYLYTFGFVGMAIFYLIISFMTDQYAFFVLRAVSALLAVLTIPSAINMIVQMYPNPAQQAKKLALFGMAGALANTLALILAGVFLLASWRWYFRFITIIVLPFAALTWYILPRAEAVAEDIPGSEKWKRMDLGGVFLMIAILVLFILGFTQVESRGWDSPIFIAPLVISVVMLPIFIIWELKMPHGYSLLPHGVWRFPNIFPLMFQASSIFMWFATYQLRAATYFQAALHNSPILSAVKLLPMGITALIAGGLTQPFPFLIMRPRYVQFVGSLLAFVGSMLLAFSGGGEGNDYWKYIFTGEIIGTFGGMFIFIGMNTSIIQSFPPQYAGVAGSFTQVIFQVGAVVGIAVQAGLLSTGDGITDWTGSKNSYFFTSAYILLTGVVFVIFYRQDKMPILQDLSVQAEPETKQVSAA